MDNQNYTREEHNAFAERVSKEFFSRNEHNEYAKRMEDEHERQNARIKELEEDYKQYHELALAISKLADSVDSLCKKQDTHGKRLDALESHDGEMWRKVTSHVVLAIVSAIAAFMLAKIGL